MFRSYVYFAVPVPPMVVTATSTVVPAVPAGTGKVLAPKVAGSLHAVRLAKEQGADFAVLVSS
ncbi:hypothetical protein ACWD4X_28225, partial [Streptomyces termitum]